MNKQLFQLIVVLIFISIKTDAQDLNQVLSHNYKSFSLESVNTQGLYNQLQDRTAFHYVSLELAGATYDLELWDSGVRSAAHVMILADGSEYTSPAPRTMKGYANGDQGSQVRLTINEGFLSGYIKYGGQTINIEPAKHHLSSAKEDLIVVYNETALIDHTEHSCGVHGSAYIKKQIKNSVSKGVSRSVGLCYEVDIALAADWSMVQAFGSESAVDNQMSAVLNDVQGNYDDEFADELLYIHAGSWISNCATCDPWTSSTDADDLLDDFTAWAPGNLGFHDVASLWTDRNFNGTTIGLAWVGAVCTNFCYNVLQNFTSSSAFLRVLQAHELGHNWDARHDSGGGFIMSPSVNSSTTWSTNSREDIEDYYATAGCFTDCTVGSPPTADFDYDIREVCVQGQVDFFDESQGATSWLWTFEGGLPATSTDQNPTVLYNAGGIFDVSLEVTNAFGSDDYELLDEIEILGEPFADFEYWSSELYVNFTNLSAGGSNLSYFWDFGDNFTSTETNPEHNYPSPGIYTVTLEIENDCDESSVTKQIEIFDEPEVAFTVDTLDGCALDTFQFTDQSYGNIVKWDWLFPGGTPSSSALQHPQIRYDSAGTYDVTLEVTNPEGKSAITKMAYILINDLPTPSFSYSAQANVVDFTNTTVNAANFLWDFGDGNFTVDTMPTHTYANSGTYQVILDASNACGVRSDTQNVTITIEPIASIGTVQDPMGCAPLTINYLDNSVGNPTSWSWTFPGGNPATSTEANPTVSYDSEGVYTVSLVVANAFGTDFETLTDFVTVTDVPGLTASYSSTMLTANFMSTATNATSMLWEFGDGSSSTEANPVHVYASEGNYNVSVMATNACGTVTRNLVTEITLGPVADFSSDVMAGFRQ